MPRLRSLRAVSIRRNGGGRGASGFVLKPQFEDGKVRRKTATCQHERGCPRRDRQLVLLGGSGCPETPLAAFVPQGRARLPPSRGVTIPLPSSKLALLRVPIPAIPLRWPHPLAPIAARREPRPPGKLSIRSRGDSQFSFALSCLRRSAASAMMPAGSSSKACRQPLQQT